MDSKVRIKNVLKEQNSRFCFKKYFQEIGFAWTIQHGTLILYIKINIVPTIGLHNQDGMSENHSDSTKESKHKLVRIRQVVK